MNCSHSNTNFNMMQWYKQSAGKNDMALIGYARFSSTVVEDQFKDTYNVSGDGSSLSSLHIPKLSPSEDSAVYFCAASKAQCCTNPPSSTKTSSDAASYSTTQNTTSTTNTPHEWLISDSWCTMRQLDSYFIH